MRPPRSVGDDRPPESPVAGPPGSGPDQAPFGRQLRLLRLQAGLTREVLAQRAGLSVATLAALEGGQRRRPYPATAVALAEALGAPPADRTRLLELASGLGTRLKAPGVERTPAPAGQAVGVRLPVPSTELVGRQAEVTAATALLDPAGSDVRLLTRVGPGGVGKTRLAVAVAAALAPAYPDGVAFVDLAALRDQRLVPATVARVLEVHEAGGRSAHELVLARLRERHLLLVLDNFEHLLGAAPLLAELLEGCPRVALLVTSRTALRLRAEHRLPVPPLALPLDGVLSPEGIQAAPAVGLFLQRARTVAPDFQLTPENASAVAGVCRRLDGMPLAIELAGARIALLPPAALLRRLERGLAVLTSGAADLPDRQQTLRQTLTWSHDLLGPADRVLFRRLAVFAGGWTLEAAEAVCAGTQLGSDQVLDRMGVIMDTSLVQRMAGTDAEPRFGMLETVREFAGERLLDSGDRNLVCQRHREWYAAMAKEAGTLRFDPRQHATLEPEADNLRAALRWSNDVGDIEAGLHLGQTLASFWYVHGWYREGQAWLGELLALPNAKAPTKQRARCLHGPGTSLTVRVTW